METFDNFLTEATYSSDSIEIDGDDIWFVEPNLYRSKYEFRFYVGKLRDEFDAHDKPNNETHTPIKTRVVAREHELLSPVVNNAGVLFGVLGHYSGWHQHIKQFNSLGFTNDRIRIFEKNEFTYLETVEWYMNQLVDRVLQRFSTLQALLKSGFAAINEDTIVVRDIDTIFDGFSIAQYIHGSLRPIDNLVSKVTHVDFDITDAISNMPAHIKMLTSSFPKCSTIVFVGTSREGGNKVSRLTATQEELIRRLKKSPDYYNSQIYTAFEAKNNNYTKMQEDVLGYIALQSLKNTLSVVRGWTCVAIPYTNNSAKMISFVFSRDRLNTSGLTRAWHKSAAFIDSSLLIKSDVARSSNRVSKIRESILGLQTAANVYELGDDAFIRRGAGKREIEELVSFFRRVYGSGNRVL